MKIEKFLSLIVGLLFLSQEYTMAQSLHGRILDENRVPLAYANIVQQDKDSTFIAGTTTGVNGIFAIDEIPTAQFLVISYLGYEKKYIPRELWKQELGDIMMSVSATTLKDVVVKGNRPYYRQKNGTLVTDIQRTSLSRLPNVNDLLAFIPGVVKDSRGNVSVFGQGAPIVYVNNRKVMSDAEWQALTPKDIKQIELITSPDAKYDASGRAVLNIITIRRNDMWSLATNTTDTQNEENSFSQDITLGLSKSKWNAKVYYRYGLNRNRVTQPQTKELMIGNDTYTYDSLNIEGVQRTTGHNFQASADYSFNTRQSVGVSVDGRVSDRRDYRTGFLAFQRNIEPEEVSSHSNKLDNDVSFMHMNSYYTGKWGKTSLDVNADYVHNSGRNNQLTTEGNDATNHRTTSNGKSRFDMMAVKADLGVDASATSHFSWGMELIHNEGNGWNNLTDASIANTKYENEENRFATYAEFKKTYGRLSFYGGLRYEMYKLVYRDLINNDGNVQRTFQNLFPSVQLSYSGGRWNHTMSLSSYVTRPSFRQLSNASYYTNEYMYQTGNPLLLPSNSYILKWQSGRAGLFLTASYTYQKNYLTTTFKTNGKVIISSFDNFDKIQYIKAAVSYQHTWGVWSPALSVGMIQPFFKSDYRGELLAHNRIMAYVSLNQTIQLPSNYSLFANAYYSTGGNQGAVELKPYHSVDLGLSKYLFHDKLTLSVKAEDLFHGMKFKEKERINNVKLVQTEDYHLWNFSVGVSYRLNSKTAKYKGKNTLSSDVQRL